MPTPRARYEITATDKTRAAVESAMGGMQKLGKTAATLRNTMFALAGAGGFGYVIKQSLEAVDKIGKTSRAVGLSAESFQKLAFAAELSGIAQSQLTSNMTAFVKRVGEARAGTGPLVSFLQKYDQELLTAIQRTKTQEEALKLIADAIENASTATDKAAIANAAFSRAGVTMVNLLRDGSDGLSDLTSKAEEAGVVIEEELVKNAEKANDALTLLGKKLSTQVNRSVVEHSESIIKLADALSTVIDKAADAAAAVEKFTTFAGKLAGAISTGDISVIDLLFDPEKAGKKIAEIEAKARKLQIPGSFAEPAAEQEAAAPEIESIARIDEIREQRSQEREQRERERLERELQRQQEQFQMKLEQVQTYIMTEEEIERQALENRQFIVEEAFQRQLITASERQRLLEKLEEQHQQKLLDIQKKSLTAQEKFQRLSDVKKIKAILASGAELTAGVANTNKTLFEVNKAFALANAAVALPDAVVQSYERAGGYPWGIIPAGLMLATGLAQIQAIKNAQFTGAGGVAPSLAPSGGGGTTIQAPQPNVGEPINLVEEQQQRIIIELDGDKVGEAMVNRAEDGRLNLATVEQ